MPRRPADSAYILAIALRKVYNAKQYELEMAAKVNAEIRRTNVKLIKNGLKPYEEVESDDVILWSGVINHLYGMTEIAENLQNVPDRDYRAIIWDSIKQPYNKVRQSKGFNKLVPELTTIRRYGPCDERHEMDISEEEARELANLIWQQEMEPFIESGRGVDPINKQIIANKVAAELKLVNVKYIGEQIVEAIFDDIELDMYEIEHEDEIKILMKGIECVEELFGYSEDNTKEKNIRYVEAAIIMYDSMLGKQHTVEEVSELTTHIIIFFQYCHHLIE